MLSLLSYDNRMFMLIFFGIATPVVLFYLRKRCDYSWGEAAFGTLFIILGSSAFMALALMEK